MPISDDRRIARNAAMLTLRLVVLTVVGLFTSRIVLQVLGVQDYGIYGVVAAITLLLAYINTSMAGATSRFITYEMGRGDRDRLARTFTSALTAHVIIGAIVVAVAETAGLWFLNHRLNIPSDRLFAANVVYQLTVVGMFVEMTQVPYNAAIIAHERMNVYAWIEMGGAALRLLAVYVLYIGQCDKLILYAALTLAVNVLIMLAYRIYCGRCFPETRLKARCDKATVMPLLKFSAHDLYGNMCFIANQQGIVFLINIFFGVLYNAALSLANTVGNIIAGLTANILNAYRPQIVKQYAGGDIATMSRRIIQAMAGCSLVYALIAMPCIVLAKDILLLWLGEVPAHAPEFLRLVAMLGFVITAINVNNVAIHATGNIKRISYINGSLYLLVSLAAWMGFRYDMPAGWAYIAYIAMCMVICMLTWWYIRMQIPLFSIGRYMWATIRAWAVDALIIVVIWHIASYIEGVWIRVLSISTISMVVTILSYWLLVIPEDMRKSLRSGINPFARKGDTDE